MRKFFYLAVFLLGIVIVIISFSELQSVVETLKKHDLRYFWIAVAVQLFWMLNDALEYRALYRLMGVKDRFKQFFLMASAATFVNVVAPTGGWGGTAVFIDNAGKRGQPRGHAAAATALYLFLDYAAFLVLLGLGIGALIRRNRLNAGEITASILMVLSVIGLGALIYIGSRSGENLGSVLVWLSRKINRMLWPLIRRDYFLEERARLFAMEVAEGLSIIHDRNERLLLPAAHALISKALMIAIMALTFVEFQVEWSIGSLVASYAIAYLFLVVSPTPSGIGVVEGILPLALASLGIPLGEAVVVTLAYRAVTFWLPMLLGGISIRLLDREV
jgi:glycosyltransferase 2 family protein